MFSGIYHSAQAALMLLCGVMTGFQAALYDIFLPLRLFRSKILLFFSDLLFGLLSGGLLICFLLLSSRGELHFYLFFCAFAGFLLQYAAMRPIISCIVGFFSRVLQKRRESRHEKRQRTEDKQ